jgi:hypothetical protein
MVGVMLTSLYFHGFTMRKYLGGYDLAYNVLDFTGSLSSE